MPIEISDLSEAAYTVDGFDGDLDAILRPMQRGIEQESPIAVSRC